MGQKESKIDGHATKPQFKSEGTIKTVNLDDKIKSSIEKNFQKNLAIDKKKLNPENANTNNNNSSSSSDNLNKKTRARR